MSKLVREYYEELDAQAQDERDEAYEWECECEYDDGWY